MASCVLQCLGYAHLSLILHLGNLLLLVLQRVHVQLLKVRVELGVEWVLVHWLLHHSGRISCIFWGFDLVGACVKAGLFVCLALDFCQLFIRQSVFGVDFGLDGVPDAALLLSRGLSQQNWGSLEALRFGLGWAESGGFKVFEQLFLTFAIKVGL